MDNSSLENSIQPDQTELFIQNIKDKVNKGVYTKKEDIISELQAYNQKQKNNSSFDEQIFKDETRKILEMYDSLNSSLNNSNNETLENFSEFTRDDGTMGATYVNGEKVVTLTQDKNNKTFREQMDIAYNEQATDKLDQNEIMQNSLENNFELLQKYVKNEEKMEKEQGKNRTGQNINDEALKSALMIYAQRNNLELEFSNDGLVRDKDGNMYEAIKEQNGDIRIQIPSKTTYENGTNVKEEAKVVYHITNEELKNEAKNDNVVDPNFHRDLAIINMAMNYPDYEAFLRDPFLHLSEEKIQYLMGEIQRNLNLIGSSYKQEENLTNQKEAAKVYVYKPKNNMQSDRKAGFANALLLASATLLFGILCVGYVFLQITK